MFSRYEYTSICWDCRETAEGIELMAKMDAAVAENYKQQMEYNAKKREKIKNEIYDGQYDWM